MRRETDCGPMWSDTHRLLVKVIHDRPCVYKKTVKEQVDIYLSLDETQSASSSITCTANTLSPSCYNAQPGHPQGTMGTGCREDWWAYVYDDK